MSRLLSNAAVFTIAFMVIFLLAPASYAICEGGPGKCVDDLNSKFGKSGSGDLPTHTTPYEVIEPIISFLLSLVALFALMAFVIGSVMYILSIGDEKKVGTAKQVMLYAIMGLLLSVLSFYLVRQVSLVLTS